MPKFDIIITSFNRLDYLKRTIGSLIQSGAIKDAQRVIVVDNASNRVSEGAEKSVQDFLEEMRQEYGFFLLLRPTNNGWGTAVNDAINLSRAEYVLLSNNDVEYTPGFHEQMLKTLEESKAFHAKGIGILGVWRHTGHGLVRADRGGVQNEQFNEMDNVPAVGWMMPKRAMEEVGMLPEHGPCFTKGGNGEDTAYVNRMKEKGYLVGVPPKDIAVHIDGY